MDKVNVLWLPDFESGTCPAREECLAAETCPEPLRCAIDRVAHALGDPRYIMIDTDKYDVYPVPP
jgi:hypothetical protein